MSTIADIAEKVIRDTNNHAVMYGDAGLLDEIARHCVHSTICYLVREAKRMKPLHPLCRWNRILSALENHDHFFKIMVRDGRSLIRCFYLIDKVPRKFHDCDEYRQKIAIFNK